MGSHLLSYLTLWDMCKGVSISSKMAPFTLDPLKLASCKSQPERSQFYKNSKDKTERKKASKPVDQCDMIY